MSLTPHDFQSQTWLKLKDHYTKRLESLRQQNDSASLTGKQTHRLRGQIFEIKQFLALDEPPPK